MTDLGRKNIFFLRREVCLPSYIDRCMITYSSTSRPFYGVKLNLKERF